MSAIPPKADIAGRRLDVRFVAETDKWHSYSIASSAGCRRNKGTSRPSAFLGMTQFIAAKVSTTGADDTIIVAVPLQMVLLQMCYHLDRLPSQAIGRTQ
jgi:hypothetical protein